MTTMFNQELLDQVDEIRIIPCAGLDENKGAEGIHLVDPDFSDIWDALEVAINQGFNVIYTHYTNVMPLRRD